MGQRDVTLLSSAPCLEVEFNTGLSDNWKHWLLCVSGWFLKAEMPLNEHLYLKMKQIIQIKKTLVDSQVVCSFFLSLFSHFVPHFCFVNIIHNLFACVQEASVLMEICIIHVVFYWGLRCSGPRQRRVHCLFHEALVLRRESPGIQQLWEILHVNIFF